MHYTPAGWVKQSGESKVAKVFGEDEAAGVMDEVLERLSGLQGKEVTRSDLLSAVVYSLSWGYRATITGMYCDQWAAVAAEAEGFSTWVECYELEVGVAMTWKLFADRREEGEMTEGVTGDAQNTANRLADDAQKLANQVVDLGEEAIGTVLGAAITANKALGDVLEGLTKKLVG